MDKENSTKPPAPTNQFSRSRFWHAFRMFGMLLIVALNIAMVGSTIYRHTHLHLAKEAIQYVFLLFFDITLLMPVIFELDKVRVEDDKLVLKGLIFTHTVPLSDVIDFKSPPLMRVSLLRTRRCFYLINKRHFERYEDLARAITSRLTLPAPEAGK